MKKRIFSLLLAVLMLVQIVPMTASAADKDQGSCATVGGKVRITEKGQTVETITFKGEKVEAKYRPHTGNNGTDTTYSCAAFVSKFYKQVYGITISGLSRKRFGPRVIAGKGGFKVTEKPKVGDVLHEVHNSVTHWAIIKKVSGNKVTVIEQNAWYSKPYMARTNAVYDITNSAVTCYHYDPAYTSGEVVTKQAEEQSALNYTLYGISETLKSTEKVSKVGMYFGTSKTNMKVLGTDSVKTRLTSMWYNTKKYYGNLKAGTTYYYQAFAVIDGKTVKGNIKSFTTEGGTTGKVTKAKKLRLRDAPNLSSNTLKWIPKGKAFSIDLSKSTKKWYYVTYNGVSGYSSKWYITLQ